MVFTYLYLTAEIIDYSAWPLAVAFNNATAVECEEETGEIVTDNCRYQCVMN